MFVFSTIVRALHRVMQWKLQRAQTVFSHLKFKSRITVRQWKSKIFFLINRKSKILVIDSWMIFVLFICKPTHVHSVDLFFALSSLSESLEQATMYRPLFTTATKSFDFMKNKEWSRWLKRFDHCRVLFGLHSSPQRWSLQERFEQPFPWPWWLF